MISATMTFTYATAVWHNFNDVHSRHVGHFYVENTVHTILTMNTDKGLVPYSLLMSSCSNEAHS